VDRAVSGAWLRDLLRDPARAASFTAAEWNDAIVRLRHARLLARFALDWRARGLVDSFPARIRDLLAAAELHHAENRASLEWEIGAIERALRAVPGEIVLLKGASYALAGLPAARGRLTNDVDVLVRRAHLAATQAALEEAGWSIRQESADERAHFLR
jgi:hypothetical protein